MNPLEIKEVLRGVDLFAKLDDELLEAFAAASVHSTFDAGDQLVSQGAPADGVFVITEGEVEGLRDSRPVATFGPGDVGGDLSLLSGQPHSLDGIAKTAGSRIVLGADEFRAAIRHHPEVSFELIRVLVNRIYYLFDAVERARKQMPPQTDPPPLRQIIPR